MFQTNSFQPPGYHILVTYFKYLLLGKKKTKPFKQI